MRSEFEELREPTPDGFVPTGLPPVADSGRSARFSAVVTHLDGRTVVELSGELDMATAPDLAERLGPLVEDGSGPVTLDVSRLEFCDSSGLAVFVEYHRRAQARGTTVALRSPSRALQRVLSLTQLDEMVEPDHAGNDADSS
jgi:anti-sigma B factor antagonist